MYRTDAVKHTGDNELFKMAVKLFEEGDYLGARTLFEQIVQMGGINAAAALQYLSKIRTKLYRRSGGGGGGSSRAGGGLSQAQRARAQKIYISSFPTRPLSRKGKTLGRTVLPVSRRRTGFIGGDNIWSQPAPGGRRAKRKKRPTKGVAYLPTTALTKLRPKGVVTRTPHIDLSNKAPMRAGQTFVVRVYADTKGPRPGERAKKISLRVPANIHQIEVQVWIVVTEHFEIQDEALKTLVIVRNQDVSSTASFKVRVKKEKALRKLPKEAVIAAYFSYHRRASGMVERAVEIQKSSMPGTAPRRRKAHPMGRLNLASGRILDKPSLRVTLGAASPDVCVEVTDPQNDLQHLRCRVQTRLLTGYAEGKAQPWNLRQQTPEIVSGFLKGFTAEEATNLERFDSLRGAGIQLFELAPKIFQDAIWDLLTQSKVPRPLTIQIVSQEPFIPWELMVPTRPKKGGTTEEHKLPVGTEFIVGRWIFRPFSSPDQKIPLRDSIVIAPQYQSDQELQHSNDETKLIRKIFPGREMYPPIHYSRINSTLGRKGASLLHFVCHGTTSEGIGEQAIELEGAGETLTSTQVRSMNGFKRAIASKKPLIFLNACEVGRNVPALVGVGGFAPAFITMGARAVVAPLWSVKDDVAFKVATAFYRELSKQPSARFAEILRKIRRKAYEKYKGEDTYAAYCFYGDPLATWARA